MSKKRTSAEFDDDEQTSEGSDSVLHKEGNAKRAKLTSLSHTTLQDLPIELLGCILVRAVAMEVKGMKLAKSVWKEKAGPVITRLQEVCSPWSSILTTDFFRNEVNRVLDGTAQDTIRLEILHQYPVQVEVSKVTTNKDEIFMLCTQQGDRERIIHVYDRNNMAEIKDVIQLPRRNANAVAACSVSSCVYVLYMDSPGITMYRITKDEDHQFSISPWISDQDLQYADISVSANGSLIILSNMQRGAPVLVSIYNANSILQHKINLLPDIYEFQYVRNVIQKSNGNLVVVFANNKLQSKLTEIDTRGRILRQYQSSVSGLSLVGLADIYGRILITSSNERMELLDSEFNLLDFTGPQLDDGQYMLPRRLHFNSARNEIVDVVYDENFRNGVLTIFRLTDE